MGQLMIKFASLFAIALGTLQEVILWANDDQICLTFCNFSRDLGLFFAIGFSDVSDSYKNDRGSSVSLGHGQEAFCLIQIGL